ncbi:hypothetical protein ACQWF3_26120, partial [Salmonella enterica subsp. enterica serovar Infantis]
QRWAMERVLRVNAEDFGLCNGPTFGLVEAGRMGGVTWTRARVTGGGVGRAARGQGPWVGAGPGRGAGLEGGGGGAEG